MTNTISIVDTERKEQVCFMHAVLASRYGRRIEIECLDDRGRESEYIDCKPCKRDRETNEVRTT